MVRAIWKFSDVKESIQQKQKDGLTSSLILSVLEAKIFQYGFLEEHNVCVNNCYWSSTYTNEVAIMATKTEVLVAKNRNASCIVNR